MQPHIPQTRSAFVPLEEWTVYFSNGPNGTDTGLLPRSVPDALDCRAIQAMCIPDRTVGMFSARILSMFSPVLAQCRHVSVIQDSGRWNFTQWGDPYPFEDVSAYGARLTRTRLTPERLYTYLAKLGVPYDVEPSWNSALVVEAGPDGSSLRDFIQTQPGGADAYWGRAADNARWRSAHPAWARYDPDHA